jgi:cytochrome c peroxidase
MRRLVFSAALAACAICAAGPSCAQSGPEWTTSEIEILRSLSLSSLPKLPPDPSNKYGDNRGAADFGHRLFFETRLSSNGKVACVTCHAPMLGFTDGKSVAVGVGRTPRNAPTIVGAAYSPWLFWDGRKDSQWSQALASIENPVEHNMPRGRVIEVIRANPDLARSYVAIFGALPPSSDPDGINRAFSNIGKAIAAYERRIMPGPAKFDRYVDAIVAGRKPAAQDEFTLDERQGLHVFISDQLGRCLRCHNGPLFTNKHFHNIGVAEPSRDDLADGRIVGIERARADQFNCLGKYSDAAPGDCAELEFARRDSPELRGAFKVPTLRNLPKTAPYMRAGDRRLLEDVLWHYRTLPNARVGKSELNDLPISATEFEQLEAFLRTLDGPIDAPPQYLRPPEPVQSN